MSLQGFLVISAILFCIGFYGALSRRNVIVVLMSVEVMLSAVILALVAFSRYLATAPIASNPAATDQAALQTLLTGQVFAIFIIIVAAAEVALGLGIVIAMYRLRETVDVTQASELKR